jgi:hypothetical protein
MNWDIWRKGNEWMDFFALLFFLQVGGRPFEVSSMDVDWGCNR